MSSGGASNERVSLSHRLTSTSSHKVPDAITPKNTTFEWRTRRQYHRSGSPKSGHSVGTNDSSVSAMSQAAESAVAKYAHGRVRVRIAKGNVPSAHHKMPSG
jgi:hypothetical protein